MIIRYGDMKLSAQTKLKRQTSPKPKTIIRLKGFIRTRPNRLHGLKIGPGPVIRMTT